MQTCKNFRKILYLQGYKKTKVRAAIISHLQFYKEIVERNFGDGKKRYEISGLPHRLHVVCNRRYQHPGLVFFGLYKFCV